ARLGAQRTGCDLSCAIDLADRPEPSERRRRSLVKAQRAGVHVSRGLSAAEEFWPLLTEVLRERHGLDPVHSLEDVLELDRRVPDGLELLVARLDGEVVAGALLFLTPMVVHCQYFAAGPRGRDVGALDATVEAAVELTAEERRRHLDFGISTES